MRQFGFLPLVIAVISSLPFVAFAATAPTDFKGLAKMLVGIIDIAIPVVMSLGVLYYLWGIAMSIKDSGSAKAWENFRTQVLWGILALFVMVSIWGILRMISNTLFPT